MAAAAPTLLSCEQHGATAGWQCSICHQPLCPDCAATKVVPPIELVACGRCGQLAEPLVRRKGQASSLAQRLPAAFLFPFKGEGLAVWLGMAMWLWVTSFLGGVGALVGWGVALGSFFGLTRSTALDRDSIELSDFQDLFQAVLLPVVRFAIATLPVWGGAALALWFDSKVLLWSALALGVLWSPTAYIGAATNTNLVNLLNPVRVLGSSARLGKDFGVYAAALAAVVALVVVSVPLSWFVGSLWVPVVAGVAAKMVLVYAPLVGARVAGAVLLLHGPVFGWGEETDLSEPVLKGVKPRGSLPVRETTLPAHLPTSIELPPEAEPVIPAAPVDRFAALEVNPKGERPPEVAPLDVSLLPSHGEQAAKEIRAAMRAGKPDVALDGFRATGLSAAPSLSFDELLWLGQTAAQHIDFESAELAFRQAVERKAPAEALSRARVMFARLLDEKLGRREDARRWMERIVAEHAGTPGATFAQQWLERGVP